MVVLSNPIVIACGHRHIRTKCGNSFPAFLIRLPENLEEPVYFWRSKRDFLLLNRATEHSFPKKAFAKLADQALSGGPWVRPDDGEALSSGGYCKLVGDAGDVIGSNNFNQNMKKSLQHLDEFLLKAFSASRKTTTDNGDEVVKAWNVFCKREHTEHLLDSSNTINNSYETHTATAARLGQYFASDENAQLVVRKMIELLEHNVGSNDFSSSSLVFIEPSCGDGRILSKLLNATKQIDADSINILGYDIDPTVIERAKAKLSGFKVALECKDFLSLSRQDLLSSISPRTVTGEEASSRKRVRAEDRKVFVLGGPPYTPKPLPQQFILHSIQQHMAEIIVFILPERCKKDADHIQQILNSTRPDWAASWHYSHTELANIDFSFEQASVQQPSVLQCWYQM